MGTSLIILAAGQGTRMNSERPKVLHPLAGVPMLWHALQAGAALQPETMVVVTGHGAEAVARAAREFDPDLALAHQAQQLGTGHAVAQALPALAGQKGRVIVLYGDTPFIRPETLEALRDHPADLVVLGFHAADPGRYGRLVTEAAPLADAAMAQHDLAQHNLARIVEWKDASPAERAITLCNSGVLCADSGLLAELVGALGCDNAAGEYYLTDVVGLARARGARAAVVTCDEGETLGINTRAELAQAEQAFQARARAQALEDGVTLQAPDTVFFSFDTVVGRDAIIGPHVVFGPGVTLESESEIRAYCHLEGCHVSRGATVGPFARLRPGAELAEDVHVGNFVEIKNAQLEEGVKVGHLTYLGDAQVGEGSNIGAGTVTCNYDGVSKHRTVIGRGAFIGSDTMLVAPVRVGDGAMTGSGSVITRDVPDAALALARARQDNKPGLAARLFEKLRADKARRRERS